MPLPARLGRFNKLVTNRITMPFASRLPGFAVLYHTGRRSGQPYATPLNAWRNDDGVVVALTYGRQVDWLKNALTSESSTMVTRGKRIRVGPPEDLATTTDLEVIPKWVRSILTILDVDEFVWFPALTQPN